MAVLNSLTIDSTGVPKLEYDYQDGYAESGPCIYTLTVGEKTIDLSAKNLGAADVNLVAVWMKRPEVSAALTKVDVRGNNRLDKAAVDALRAAAPETCKILVDY